MNAKAQMIGVSVIAAAVSAVAWCLQASITNPVSELKLLEIGDIGGEYGSQFSQEYFYLPNDTMAGFVEIPAGEFLMGSDPAVDNMAYDNERWSAFQRQGRVNLSTYYISRYEVSTAQFKLFANETQHPVNGNSLPKNAFSPIVNITWTDALSYCQWLEEKIKNSESGPAAIKELLSQGWSISLPTEAQWEKAARGDKGNVFPWGNELTNRFANFSSQGIKPVGSTACESCAYSLADMSGNVWELTRSPYLAYPFSEDADVDLEGDALFVMRGGSYSDQINNVRAATRGGVDPGVRSPNIGFRLVISHE